MPADFSLFFMICIVPSPSNAQNGRQNGHCVRKNFQFPSEDGKIPSLKAKLVKTGADPDVTQILQDWSAADKDATAELIPIVYEELRRLARQYLGRERQDHTLQATALVHEAYLKLVDQSRVTWQSRRRCPLKYVAPLMFARAGQRDVTGYLVELWQPC